MTTRNRILVAGVAAAAVLSLIWVARQSPVLVEDGQEAPPVSADDPAAAKQALNQLEATASWGSIAHLPVWSEVQSQAVAPGVRLLLREVETAFAALEAEPGTSWAGLMAPLERLDTRLDQVLGRVNHLLSTKYSDALQQAYDEVRPDYVRLRNRIGQSQRIYEAMLSLRQGPEHAQMSVARQRILDEAIRDMERSGVHLDTVAKARFSAIRERLAELSDDFRMHLVKQEQDSRIKITDQSRLAGIPAAIVDQAAEQARADGVSNPEAAGPWHFVVNAPNYLGVVQQGEDRALRETFYRAWSSRGEVGDFDNRPIVGEILRLRQEMAVLLGYSHYADYSLDAKMASDTAAVWGLLAQIEAAARPVAEAEYAELRRFMADQGAVEAEAPEPWDLPYWREKQRQSRYSYDEEGLRSYFQMPLVFDGLFRLVRDLYGVEVRRVVDGSVPVWDDSVSFFEVLEPDASGASRTIAGLYVDPYARPGEKRGGAWMNTVVDRSRLLGGESGPSLPVALFVMNARPPLGDAPALMSLGEVRTLFHEFGHAMQHMFTRIDESGASGLNLVAWDAVELASQFNEFWMDHAPFLKALTAHVENGEALDDDTLGRIVESRNFMAGNGVLRQLRYAKTDMLLHETWGLDEAAAGPTPFDLEAGVVAETIVLPTLPGETQLPSFGHLFSGGYAAGYYSYKWAEVLAADAFGAFREVGLDNEAGLRTVAQRFRDTVLALGGSRPAAEVYRLFRGRDAEPEALLRELGLTP